MTKRLTTDPDDDQEEQRRGDLNGAESLGAKGQAAGHGANDRHTLP
jgi:hypothetical protein